LEVYPARDVVLARELTKKFEEFLRGKPAELLAITAKRSLKGEFVVMVAGADAAGRTRAESSPEGGSREASDDGEVQPVDT
jgi:16S rRNA (cytidine1402-2'-O)-methyltransferase